MPLTIPSHQAAVLPLKLWRPRRFDGVALVVGSAAPDVASLVAGSGLGIRSHAWHALFWFSLPVTLALTTLLRRSAGIVAAHLPPGGPLRLRDYGVLATVHHPLAVSAYSALLGAASHLLWDSFTHPYIVLTLAEGYGVHALHQTAVAGLPWWRVLQLVSDALGTLAVVLTAVHIGRSRLLVAWHGPAPEVPRRPVLFWSVSVVGLAALTAAAWAMPSSWAGINVLGTRQIAAVALALLAGAAAVSFRSRAAGVPASSAPERAGSVAGRTHDG